MRFSKKSRLDTSQIDDQRDGQSSKAGGGNLRRNWLVYLIAGGGLTGLLAILLVSLLTAATTSLLSGQSVGSNGEQMTGDLDDVCQTGADANERADCRIVGTVNSVQVFWEAELSQNDPSYRFAPTTFFDGAVMTGCGRATSRVGPFYCPANENIYIDLGFYDSLRSDFGAKGGPFAEAYVIAHEYGHHVQHVLGFDDLVGRDRQGPESGAVRLELQADCYAGVWAAHAEQTGFIEDISRADILDGLNAASVIGDDRIQEATTGRVNPEHFTHGTSAQREKWFFIGYQSGDPSNCDTWTGDI